MQDRARNEESEESPGGNGAALPVSLAEEQETFYTIEDGPPFADEDHSAVYVTPFQPSAPLAPSRQLTGKESLRPNSSIGRLPGRTGWPPWLRFVAVTVVVMVGGAFLFTVLFGSSMLAAHQPATKGALPHQLAVKQAQEPPQARPQPTVRVTPQPANWVPQHLPTGWTNVGRSMGDGLFAQRTALTFVDREESLDYRNVGTRAQHAGTFTAAVFLLTPAARQRFAQNDVRVADNALFDRVGQQQLIQAAVNEFPRLVALQVQGQQQFALVDVAFQLWQSVLDPNATGQRIERLEMDPATNQPRLHHMLVLLLHVDITLQGANAPMGGTGWLVSNYALDQAGGMLPIVQPA